MIPVTIAEFKPAEAMRLPSARRTARVRPVRKQSGGLRIIDVRATLERDRRHAMATPDRRTVRYSLIHMGQRAIEGIAVVEEASVELTRYAGLSPLSPLWECLRAAKEIEVRFDLYRDWLEPRRRLLRRG